MDVVRMEIVCDDPAHSGRPRIVDTFTYAPNVETGEMQWRWDALRKMGGGKRDPITGLRDWVEDRPSHRTVRSDHPDGVRRVRILCKGHSDIGMPWDELLVRYLDPARRAGLVRIPIRQIVSSRTNPTRRRNHGSA